MTVVLTLDEVPCVGPGCGDRFWPQDGWSGLCPSCVALAEEHLVGVHEEVAGCPHCC